MSKMDLRGETAFQLSQNQPLLIRGSSSLQKCCRFLHWAILICILLCCLMALKVGTYSSYTIVPACIRCFTNPLFWIDPREDYMKQASSARVAHTIGVPTLALNAHDDPICPSRYAGLPSLPFPPLLGSPCPSVHQIGACGRGE